MLLGKRIFSRANCFPVVHYLQDRSSKKRSIGGLKNGDVSHCYQIDWLVKQSKVQHLLLLWLAH
jgi:hypothetical protein